VIKPTEVPATGLSNSIVNPDAVIGILAQNEQEFRDFVAAYSAGSARGVDLDPQTIGYLRSIRVSSPTRSSTSSTSRRA
jgi:hypothetical protein